MTNVFDFIIVGGGTSGSVVASRLANSSSSPKVLLLEAGGPNDNLDTRTPANRYMLPFTQPSMTYQYASIPQKLLNNRVITCARGRGLGGSSAINFSCWVRGHKDDYNEWADLVDDDAWKWDGEGGVEQRFRKIENVHDDIEENLEKYIGRDALRGHSKDGKVDLSYGKVWNEVDSLTLEGGIQYTGGLNTDMNSGDPTGFGMGPTSYYNGHRVTAATAYLASSPVNLTIKTDSPAAKVLIDVSKRAVGVTTISGESYFASKEVIVSAGAIDSPKILLLSGVGPAKDLAKLSIPVTHDLPTVGNHLIDHSLVTTTLLRKYRSLPADHDFHGDVGLQAPMAWLSNSVVKSSAEFEALDEKLKTHLAKVPTYEFLVTPAPMAQVPTERENAEVITFVMANMNAQSEGSITLASSDPTAKPVIDLNYFSHPYDRRVVIEGLRSIIEFSKMPVFEAVTEKRIEGPDGDSDEALWEHAKKCVQPVWHFAGTCRMGKDDESVVDREFKVRGVSGLRVVDLSVAPLMTNNHTQSTAYLIGETASEKLIAEYQL